MNGTSIGGVEELSEIVNLEATMGSRRDGENKRKGEKERKVELSAEKETSRSKAKPRGRSSQVIRFKWDSRYKDLRYKDCGFKKRTSYL